MAGEFDLEYMNECMEAFDYSCPDNEVFVEKLDEICRVYKQSVDDIVDEIVSILQNEGKKLVTMNVILNLEKKLEQKQQREVELSRSAKRTNVRKPLADRTMATLGKSFVEEVEGSTASEKTEVIEAEKYMRFAPFDNSIPNNGFFNRKDIGKVTTEFKGAKYTERDQGASMTSIGKIEVVSKAVRDMYGGDKASLAIEAKFRRFGEIAKSYREAYPEITDWGNPLAPAVESVFTYGQIFHDDEAKDNERFGENNVSLMIDDDDGSMIRLDLSRLSDDVSMFPGQIVALSGINETGEKLIVDRIFDAPMTPPPKPFTSQICADVWFASGPFTSPDNCGYEQLCELLEQVVEHQPNLLILTGPFIDKKNNFLTKNEFTITYDTLLEQLFIKMARKLDNTKTQIIIQPSSVRDATIIPVFPASAFDFSANPKIQNKFHFVADPCIVRMCDGQLEIAITSSEAITHLSKHEYHRSANQENVDRIARLYSHLLKQKCLYPLEPSEIPSSLEKLLEVASISSAPHIVMAPCVLAPTVKTVGSTAFVNPSSLARGASGTFIRARINAKSGATRVAEFTNFEVVKV
ncbi:unnamed protein product [Caenorhabditis bovis]|uniref:DNA polymerase alpha subunit B n=1 Tax=Caenorhabditis bovis TaxID=2654633 RepID=A0A8S1EP34_9PELO|nr:unnamed protein product [Caenorhabditis bovis]